MLRRRSMSADRTPMVSVRADVTITGKLAGELVVLTGVGLGARQTPPGKLENAGGDRTPISRATKGNGEARPRTWSVSETTSSDTGRRGLSSSWDIQGRGSVTRWGPARVAPTTLPSIGALPVRVPASGGEDACLMAARAVRLTASVAVSADRLRTKETVDVFTRRAQHALGRRIDHPRESGPGLGLGPDACR